MFLKKLYPVKILPKLIPLILIMTVLVSSPNLILAEPTRSTSRNSGSVSLQEYEALGIKFADAIATKNIQKLAQLFDMKSFAYISARTVYESKKDIEAYGKNFAKLNKEKFLGQIFVTVIKSDINVKFLRILKGNRPLVRIDFQDGGHEYTVLDVKLNTDNKLMVVDLFILTTGSKLSVTMGVASQLMLRPSKSILRKIFGKLDIDEDIFSSIKKLGQLKKEGKFVEAYNLIETFPDGLKNKRVMIDTSIQLSQFMDDDAYRKQLTRLDKYFGTDKSTAFILIDHYYFNEDYKKAHASINRLINSFGEDGALFNLKASTYYVTNNHSKTQAYARKAIKVEPQFEDAYWTLATSLTDTENYSELVKLLNIIENKFNYTFTPDNFADNELYAKFVKTPEFKAMFK